MPSRTTGTCKLTGKYGRFVDCHLVPRSFLDIEQLSGDVPLKIYSLHKRQFPKASQTGLYDKTIVCDEGERILADLDTVANRLLHVPIARDTYLRNEHGLIARDNSGKKLAYAIASTHYARLKLFALSIFWRASVSCRTEVAGFQLDSPIESRIRSLLVSNDAGRPEELSVLISRYTNNLGAPHITPSRLSVLRIPFVHTTFGQYHFYMKIADAETPVPIDEMQLDPRRPLPILLGDFFETGLGQQTRSKFTELYDDKAT